MRRLIFTILFIAGLNPAIAAEAPVQKPTGLPETGLTIQDCLNILSGLNALDNGYQRVVAAGKPTESTIVEHYDFPPAFRDAQTHDIFMLGQIQQEAQSANRRAQIEIGKGETIKPGTVQNLEFDDRMSQYTQRPCTAQLDHIRKDDLVKANVPATIRALIFRITD